MAKVAQPPVVLMATDAKNWKRLHVISDGAVSVIRLFPCPLGVEYGWKVAEVDVQGADSWDGMPRDKIHAWLLHSAHDHYQPASAHEDTFAVDWLREQNA